MTKTIYVDFDGVLHSYTSGWQGPARVDDPPVAGAINWLRELIAEDSFEVAIYSSRSSQVGGIPAMLWLRTKKRGANSYAPRHKSGGTS